MEQTRDSVLRYGESIGCELLNFFVLPGKDAAMSFVSPPTGLLMTWALILNLAVQSIAFCFGIACAIALFRKPPACLVGANLAAWTLYVAAFAFAVPVCLGLITAWGYGSRHPDSVGEAFTIAGVVLRQSAALSSPAFITAVAVCLASYLRLRVVPRGPAPELWYGTPGTLAVFVIFVPALLLASLAGLLLLLVPFRG